jgi:hypothetical protein
MADLSVRSLLQGCIGKSGTLSVREDALGVYSNDNPSDRSLKDRLFLIRDRSFVRVALVTVRPVGSALGQNANLQRDLDNANLIYQNECDAWVYAQDSIVENTDLLGANGILDQDDCASSGHSVSDEEDELYDLGRDLGAEVVGYYIAGDVAGFAGCAAHPPGRRGFWVGNGSPWTFAHELTHVIGDNAHVTNSNNLMFTPTANITNPPPDLTDSQCERILDDPDMESC